MSRNSKKLNKTNPGYNKVENNNQQQTPEDNPFGLSFVVPTETIELPSRGKYYPSISPWHGRSQVEIKHMTAREEDLLSSVTEDDNTNLFERLIQGLLLDKTLNASELLEEDKMAILYFARKTGYGDDYLAFSFCNNCEQTVKFKFDLNKYAIKEPEKEILYNSDESCFEVTTPVANLRVKLLKLTSKDLEEIEKEREKKKELNLNFNYTISCLLKSIVSVNDVVDRPTISSLLDVLPAGDAKFLINYDKNIFPQIDTSQEVECPECGHVAEREVPLSWAFFRIDV